MKLIIDTDELFCPMTSKFEVNDIQMETTDFGNLVNKQTTGDFRCEERVFVPFPIRNEIKDRLGIDDNEYLTILDILSRVKYRCCSLCD